MEKWMSAIPETLIRKRGITYQVYMFRMEEPTEIYVEHLSSPSCLEFVINL